MLFQLNQFKSYLCVCVFSIQIQLLRTIFKMNVQPKLKQKKKTLKQDLHLLSILTKIFVYISAFFLSFNNKIVYFLPNTLSIKKLIPIHWLNSERKMLPWTMLDKTNQPNQTKTKLMRYTNRKTNQPKTKLQSHHNNTHTHTRTHTHTNTHR